MDGQVFSGESTDGLKDDQPVSSRRIFKEVEDEDEMFLTCVHTQRIPANSKVRLIRVVFKKFFEFEIAGYLISGCEWRWEYRNGLRVN